MSFPGTTLEDAQRASLLFALDQVKLYNSSLEKRYNNNHDSWKTMVEAGIIPNTNPPTVPMGWEPYTQADGFTYERLGTTPVCAARTDIPDDHTQQKPVEIAPIDQINIPPGDTRPTSSIVTGLQLLTMGANPAEIGSPGSRWEKRERGGPWGVWRWYQRL